ncbi:FCD domain-containing protein, partial [Acinetobacter baumannii]
MFELRQILERAVLDKVGHSANPKAAIAPRVELVKEERQACVTHDRPRWIRLSAEFHVALAEQAGNPLVVEMMRRLVS